MKKDTSIHASEKREPVEYEQPRIKDYGTLAELTAGKGPSDTETWGGRDNGGGYS